MVTTCTVHARGIGWLVKSQPPPPRVLLTLTADFIQKCAPTHATLKHTMLVIFYSPLTAAYLAPQAAHILSEDTSTNHHPITLFASAAPLPFRDHVSLKRHIFRKLKAPELESYKSKLTPLAEWCQGVLSYLPTLPIHKIQDFTDKVTKGEHMTREDLHVWPDQVAADNLVAWLEEL